MSEAKSIIEGISETTTVPITEDKVIPSPESNEQTTLIQEKPKAEVVRKGYCAIL